jgi:hypothetical protein
MKTLGLYAALLCLSGALAVPLSARAQAFPVCGDTLETDNLSLNPGYLSCRGPVTGTFAAMMDLVQLQNRYPISWSRLGYSTDTNFGPFSSNPVGLRSGTLTLDTPRHDLFVIGLQALNRYVFYQFDYSALAATSSIRFDTLGLSTTSTGPALQAAALYIPLAATATPVSEPGTWTLALVGLSMLAVAGRRRGAG